MQELLAQYELLLGQAARAPGVELARHSLVTERGRAVLPDPTIALTRPTHASIADAFMKCVARWPERIAISDSSGEVTYRELERRSRFIASMLIKEGAKPGEMVAVSARGSAVVAAMVGVLRSGASLLTIDPELPLGRRRSMIEQARVQRLISFDANADEELTSGSLRLLPVTLAGSVSAPELTASELPTVELDPPAHARLAHFLDWQRTRFELMPEDRVSQFGASIEQSLLALTSGATLCIFDDEPAPSWFEAQRVNVLHARPSQVQRWLSKGIRLPDLRLVFFTGEPLTEALVERFRSALGTRAMLVNLYGPAQTSLAACFQVVANPAEPGIQPVGRALPDTQVLVLNAKRTQCGLGEVGEVGIRGERDASESSVNEFIKNPFNNDNNDIVYLTGDRGRCREDGLLEIVERRAPIAELPVLAVHASARAAERPAQSGNLVTIQAGKPERAPVYWLPGGDPLFAFGRVSRALGASQPVFGLEPEVDLERAPRTIEGIAASCIRAIQKRQPHGPYHLLGFGLGAFTAYEMAIQLQHAGEELGLLCVFEAAPGNVLRGAERVFSAAQHARRLPSRMTSMARSLMRNRLVLKDAFSAVLEHNRRAATDYMRSPLKRFDGRVSVFLAQESSLNGVAAWLDPRVGWRRSCREIEVHRVPGDRRSLLEDHAEALGLVLRGVIDAAAAMRRDSVELKSSHAQAE